MAWPYRRPRPPRARFGYDYQRQFGVIAVYRTEAPSGPAAEWIVDHESDHFTAFPTHAEAIVYAQELAQERISQ